nr:MAG TPA: hypothetical protein [Caudoviricetes sp.]
MLLVFFYLGEFPISCNKVLRYHNEMRLSGFDFTRIVHDVLAII